MKKIKNDNRGVTLVEIILGVVILAIITVPLLHTFVVGAGSSRKSAQLASLTTAAENLAEKIKATDVSELMGNAAVLGGGAGFLTRSPNGALVPAGYSAPYSPNKIYYIQVPQISSGNREFTALVTLDGNTDTNMKPIGVSNQMDATINMKGYDDLALSEFISECTEIDEDGKIVYRPEIGDLTRNISISAVSEKRDENTKTADYNIEVLFHYSCAARGFARTFTTTASLEQIKDSEYGSSAFSVYLFYDAFYKTEAFMETINIINPYNKYLDFNVFLINTGSDTAPTGYGAEVKYMNQRYLNSQTTCSRVFTNIAPNYIKYKAFRDSVWHKIIHVTGYLVEEKSVDRRYHVNIQLFDPAEGINGNPLMSMDAKKLD